MLTWEIGDCRRLSITLNPKPKPQAISRGTVPPDVEVTAVPWVGQVGGDLMRNCGPSFRV